MFFSLFMIAKSFLKVRITKQVTIFTRFVGWNDTGLLYTVKTFANFTPENDEKQKLKANSATIKRWFYNDETMKQ